MDAQKDQEDQEAQEAQLADARAVYRRAGEEGESTFLTISRPLRRINHQLHAFI